MVWSHGGVPDFEHRVLAGKTWFFNHGVHGQLRITRAPKAAISIQINFQLQLITGVVTTNAVCHLIVTNSDPTSIGLRVGQVAHQHTSSVSYGDIDISAMGGMGIGYLVHHVFALTGIELGVALFVVESITNPAAMDPLCQHSGMGAARHSNAYQAPCGTVRQAALQRANYHNWH